MDDGKYRSWGGFARARLQRALLRAVLRPLVAWSPLPNPAPGCTAIIGLCSRLPDVMLANARCLRAARWPELRRVVIAVDGQRGSISALLEAQVRALLGDLPCQFVFYGPLQARVADWLRLPYVYSWMSWSLALAEVDTEAVLVHDYDALLLGTSICARYEAFRASGARVQGVRWYKSNGIREEDRLATTFEAFVDAAWLRAFPPLRMFNQIGRVAGRSVDFDTLLELQANETTPAQRSVVPMAESELTHPSQMIHQYTMFRRQPAAALPCYSIPMIPFFSWLGGRGEALQGAATAIEAGPASNLRMLGDDVRVSLAALRLDHVDWLLKQMVQACMSLGVPPAADLARYGEALYAVVRAPREQRWTNHFLPEQCAWIAEARRLARAEPAPPAP